MSAEPYCPAPHTYALERTLTRPGVYPLYTPQVHWPDRYVSLFGSGAYDINQERPDDVPFEEQLRGLENVVKAGKARA